MRCNAVFHDLDSNYPCFIGNLASVYAGHYSKNDHVLINLYVSKNPWGINLSSPKLILAGFAVQKSTIRTACLFYRTGTMC